MGQRREIIKLTEEMILDLMRGKDLHLVLNAEKEEDATHFYFRGPFDGVFLTHREINDLQYQSEMNVLGLISRIQKPEKEYKVKQEKE